MEQCNRFYAMMLLGISKITVIIIFMKNTIWFMSLQELSSQLVIKKITQLYNIVTVS